MIEGKPYLAMELLKEPLENMPTGYLWEDSWTLWIKGFTCRMIGDFDFAIDAFHEALNICERRLWVDMVCYTDLGVIYHQQGRLQEAQETFLHGLALQKFHTAANHGYLARLIAGLCDVLLDRHELEESIINGNIGLEWLQWWPSGNTWSDLFTVLGRVRLAEGDLKAASELIFRADQERRSWPLRPINNSLVDDALVRLWLAQNDVGSLEHWAKFIGLEYQMRYNPDQIPDESIFKQLISLARIRLAQGRAGNQVILKETSELLASLANASQKSGRIRSRKTNGLTARSHRADPNRSPPMTRTNAAGSAKTISPTEGRCG